MPSTLFNVLFLVALIVPLVMYVCGVLLLLVSLVIHHRPVEIASAASVEAIAH